MKITTVKVDNVEEIGVFTGASVYGIGLITSVIYSVCAFFGCSCEMAADKIEAAKNKALDKMKMKAMKEKADGIMGVSFDISGFSVLVSGTAYRFVPEEEIPEI